MKFSYSKDFSKVCGQTSPVRRRGLAAAAPELHQAPGHGAPVPIQPLSSCMYHSSAPIGKLGAASEAAVRSRETRLACLQTQWHSSVPASAHDVHYTANSMAHLAVADVLLGCCEGYRGAGMDVLGCHLGSNDIGLMLQVVLELACLLGHRRQLLHQHVSRLCQRPAQVHCQCKGRRLICHCCINSTERRAHLQVWQSDPSAGSGKTLY